VENSSPENVIPTAYIASFDIEADTGFAGISLTILELLSLTFGLGSKTQ
jgi:hypothetical protein